MFYLQEVITFHMIR